MFTFGREHERRCAVAYVKDPTDAAMAEHVVDAVHDFLEGKSSGSTAAAFVSQALMNGGSGVWEQAGSWLAKLSREHAEVAAMWAPMLAASSSRQRFRLAAFICDVPDDVLRVLLPALLNDKSTKVRSKVVGDLTVTPRPAALKFLQTRLPHEQQPDIASQLVDAIKALRTS